MITIHILFSLGKRNLQADQFWFSFLWSSSISICGFLSVCFLGLSENTGTLKND